MIPTTEKSHVSNILYKAYTDKTVIFRIVTMNTVIISVYSLVFVHGYLVYVYYMYRSV